MPFRKLILLTLLSTTVIAAEVEDSKYYVQGSLGYATGVAPGGDFEKNTLRDATVSGIALGYRYDDHLRADVSLEYRTGFKNEYSNQITNKYGTTVIDTQTSTVSSLASMLTAYYDIAEINKVTPYVLLGAGISRNVVNSSGFMTFSNSSPNISYSLSKGISTSLAYKIGAGAKYSIDEDFYLDAHYQYISLGKITTGNVIRISNRTLIKSNEQGKLQSHEISVGLGYKF
jgi:opacity protein-like surface antigen